MIGDYILEYGPEFLGGMFIVLFCGAIAWMVLWLVDRNNQSADQSSNRIIRKILNKSYIHGELSKKEYLEMKHELSRGWNND